MRKRVRAAVVTIKTYHPALGTTTNNPKRGIRARLDDPIDPADPIRPIRPIGRIFPFPLLRFCATLDADSTSEVTLRKLVVGGWTVSPPFALAPLAELTEPPFRALVRDLGGCGLFTAPMLSPAAIRAHETHRIPIDGVRRDGDPPLVVQIAPSRHDYVEDVIARLLRQIAPDGIDVNMGCAAPRVRRTGAGAALLSHPDVAIDLVRRARRAFPGTLTIKMRLPGAGSFEELHEFAARLAAEGVDAIALHPRLAREGFTRSARWELVALLAAVLPIPVIGSGDVRTARAAIDRLAASGASAVMIGRGALCDPWIFAEIAALSAGRVFTPPTTAELRDRILALVDGIAAWAFPAGRAAARIALACGYLLEPTPFGRRVALELKRLDDVGAQRARLERHFDRLADDGWSRPDSGRHSSLTSKET
jgi:tRNA-dihydrouridine synthase B